MQGATTLSASSTSVQAAGTVTLSLQIDSSLTPSTAQVTWSVWPAIGSVGASGIYTAPATVPAAQNIKVVALVVPANVSLPPVVVYAPLQVLPAVNVALTPASASLAASGTTQFQATVTNSSNTSVTWSLSPNVGSISSSGLYSAPASIAAQQTVTVTAASAASSTAKASATITLLAPVAVSLTPLTATLSAGQTSQLTATVANSGNSAVTWSLSSPLGSISAGGLYTAPASVSTQEALNVTATSVADPTKSASASITLLPQSAITLPLEVMGANGATQTVAATVPASANLSGNLSLQVQIHGLEYETQASVQVNSSSWIALNSTSAQVQGLAANYGGIGGGFSTLTLQVPLPAAAVQAGTNKFSFRFNATDGNSSGFRILAFNVRLADGTLAIPASAFTTDNPAAWTAPTTAPSDIAAGQSLFQTAPIFQPQANGAAPVAIKAHCGDCHAADGRDLKYFNYSNAAIYSRAMWHGLNSTQAQQIVSYIRTLNAPAPGQARPWNPPYQPGAGLDAVPAGEWAAGAGLKSVLGSDSGMEPYLVPNGSTAGWAANQTLNTRQLPIALQLPDWNHWLPRIHPMDAYGSSFTASQYAALYPALKAQLIANNTTAYGNALDTIQQWQNAQDAFLSPMDGSITNWTATQRTSIYSAAEWMMIKLWEINQQFGLEGMPQVPFGVKAESSRAWYSTRAFMTSPNMLHITPGPGLGNGSLITQEYLAYIWYHLQMILNPGNGTEQDHTPIDFPYVDGFVKSLTNDGNTPEAMLQLAWLVKGLQEETLTGIAPQNGGWYWDASDPELLVDHDWGGMWSATSSSDRLNLMNAYLQLWFNQASTYTPGQYYAAGNASTSDTPATMNPNNSFGGAMWWMMPRLRYYGVSPTLVSQYYLFVSGIWPSANWNQNKAASCTPDGPGLKCSTD